jgi:hypothetical protein
MECLLSVGAVFVCAGSLKEKVLTRRKPFVTKGEHGFENRVPIGNLFYEIIKTVFPHFPCPEIMMRFRHRAMRTMQENIQCLCEKLSH